MVGSQRQSETAPTAGDVVRPAKGNVVRSRSGDFDVAISDFDKLFLDHGLEVGTKVGPYRIAALARDSDTKEPVVVYTDGTATWVRALRLWETR
jgi:hypothetical protein